MTIVEAIQAVMATHRAPMTATEVYEAISVKRLYEFRAANPASIVRTQMRRHTEGMQLATSSKVKHFRALPDGRFELI